MNGRWVELLGEILRSSVKLTGAACRDRGDLFLSEDADDQAAAVEICRTCPVLTECRRWVESLPRSQRPGGVVAGQVHQPRPPGLPRKTEEKI